MSNPKTTQKRKSEGQSTRTRTSKRSKSESNADHASYITSHLFDKVIWSSNAQIKPVDYKGIALEEKEDANLFIIEKGTQTKATGFETEILKAAQVIKSAEAALIIAGAGIGCDSNLPDYRSKNGFWNDYAPIKDLGISLKKMSQSAWFETDASLAWGFYNHRKVMYDSATPHDGFHILHNLVKELPNGWFVFTSNIDSQFQKAEFDERRVFESHGSLAWLQCVKNCRKSRKKILPNDMNLDVDRKTFRVARLGQIKRCRFCKEILRPNVSFFSDTEQSFNGQRRDTQKKKLLKWLKSHLANKTNLAVIEIGCGTSVHSLRCESDLVVEESSQATLIRINPQNYQVTGDRHVGIGLGAQDALKKIDTKLKMLKGNDSE